jgi:hypothetical protein
MSIKSLEILDDSNSKIFKENAFKRAKNYDIENVLPEYMNLYKRVIKGGVK